MVALLKFETDLGDLGHRWQNVKGERYRCNYLQQATHSPFTKSMPDESHFYS